MIENENLGGAPQGRGRCLGSEAPLKGHKRTPSVLSRLFLAHKLP